MKLSIYDDLIKANRERVYSEAARPLMMIRRQRGEAPFGFIKMFGGLSRFAGRRLEYAAKKTQIAAAGWNLLIVIKKMMRESATIPCVRELLKPVLALLGFISEILELNRHGKMTKKPSQRLAAQNLSRMIQETIYPEAARLRSSARSRLSPWRGSKRLFRG